VPGDKDQQIALPRCFSQLTFQKVLSGHHYTAVIRHSKGGDIGAACGQLRAKIGNGQPEEG